MKLRNNSLCTKLADRSRESEWTCPPNVRRNFTFCKNGFYDKLANSSGCRPTASVACLLLSLSYSGNLSNVITKIRRRTLSGCVFATVSCLLVFNRAISERPAALARTVCQRFLGYITRANTSLSLVNVYVSSYREHAVAEKCAMYINNSRIIHCPV